MIKPVIAICIVVVFGFVFAYYTNRKRRKELTDYYQSLKDRAPVLAWLFMLIDWTFNLNSDNEQTSDND